MAFVTGNQFSQTAFSTCLKAVRCSTAPSLRSTRISFSKHSTNSPWSRQPMCLKPQICPSRLAAYWSSERRPSGAMVMPSLDSTLVWAICRLISKGTWPRHSNSVISTCHSLRATWESLRPICRRCSSSSIWMSRCWRKTSSPTGSATSSGPTPSTLASTECPSLSQRHSFHSWYRHRMIKVIRWYLPSTSLSNLMSSLYFRFSKRESCLRVSRRKNTGATLKLF